MGATTKNPQIWILGITPGWNQMKIAYKSAAIALRDGMSNHEAALIKKPKVAFAGSMRKNLISMLDELNLNNHFEIPSSSKLFESEFLRTGSILKYSVFKNNKNYTGHAPNPTKHSALKEMLDVVLGGELDATERCLIVPLGKAVEEALNYCVSIDKLDPGSVLYGFPHPSGANGHRVKQFHENKQKLESVILNWFN